MKWSNVKLIFVREARDQLRDRRTLFTIAVLPLLLYPLLGMSFLQISQFMREHPTSVWVIGAGFLPQDPPLLIGERFAPDLTTGAEGRLLTITVDEFPPVEPGDTIERLAQRKIRAGVYDAVVSIPPSFGEQLERFSGDLDQQIATSQEPHRESPHPQIFINTANDKSRIAGSRVESVLQRWRGMMVEQNLELNAIPISATHPFEVLSTDVAEDISRRAAVWSKILPFVVLIWALTGAFYPAIDLCAGEKERGTLETLLSSPASREEIVLGKLMTVMCFSLATSLLNLSSMGFTGLFIMGQMQQIAGDTVAFEFGPPPLASLAWLVVALIPISALFSALALAIAAFARSSKEGQYYLLPLLMITLPLMLLPMIPASELDLGTSLIPISGAMMLMRALIEGQYREALIYLPPVALVTGICCLLAIRWAVDQFRNESVLFRESERFGVGLWLRHVMRDRGDTPSVAEAVMCGLMLLMIRFFAGFATPIPSSWSNLVMLMAVTQLALIATPALLMAIMLTRRPTRTLLLRPPKYLLAVPVAVLLATFLHPASTWLSEGIRELYPISDDTISQLEPFSTLISQAPLWNAILLLALLPAVCEELAFRGFILSGLRHMGHKWGAIAAASLLFGLAHGILQQSLAACATGLIIGYVAVQTGSLLPAIAYHFTHNALAVCASRVTEPMLEEHQVLGWLMTTSDAGIVYHPTAAAICGGFAALLIWWLSRLPYERYPEEKLRDALAHQMVDPHPEAPAVLPASSSVH